MAREEHKTPAAARPQPVYNIRAAAGATSCTACGRRFTASGPVGHRDDEPICDLCLLEGSTELGMALALISVTRAYASIVGRSPEEWLDPLRELGVFARVYGCFAAKSGPPRLFPIPGLGGKDETPAPLPPAVGQRKR